MNLKRSNSVWRTASISGNDSAQVAVIFFFFLAIAFVGFYWIMLGSMMDTSTSISNNLTAAGNIPMSAERYESMKVLQGAFGSIPILAFIFFIIGAIMAALSSRYQTV